MNTEDHYNELFKGLKGQKFATQILESALRENCIATAYLFSGPEGVGKKQAALKFIEGIIKKTHLKSDSSRILNNLNFPDLLWIEPTYIIQGNIVSKSQADKENLSKKTNPQIRIEQIKKVKEFLSKNPIEINKSIVVIESAETINESAANSLLKTLEEPKKAMFILITNRRERILQTIISRCQIIPFIRLSDKIITDILNNFKQENKNKDNFFEFQAELINISNGSPGELIKNLKFWEEIPKEIINNLKDMSQEATKNLTLAKEITEKLNLEQQVWIIDLLQNFIWLNNNDYKKIKRLEKLRSQLFSFVQPRLAWEIALLEINLLN